MSPPPAAPRPAPGLRALLSLAWPIIVSRASQTVVGLADAVMVAPLGAASLAATATGASNVFTLMTLPLGITFIVASFSAQLHGRGDAVGARRFGWYGLAVALGAEVLALALLPAVGPVLGLLPYEPEVASLMTTYMRVRLMSGGAAIGLEALANYYGGLGRTRPGMVANVVAMVLNVALNWLLIDGHLGAPALGVTGAALASALSTTVAFGGFFVFFLRQAPAGHASRLRLAELRRMLRFGLPGGLNWFFEAAAFVFFFNVVVAQLGTAALAAMNGVIALNSLAFMPAFGLASAGAILVGQALGAGAPDEVPRLVWLTGRAAAAWQGLVGAAYVAMPAVLMQLFARGEGAEALSAIGVRMLMVSAAWQLFDATAMVLTEALRAAGDTLFPLLARLVLGWALFVPGSYLTVTAFGGGEVAAASWVVLFLMALAATLVWRFWRGHWRHIALVEPELVAP